MDVDAEAGPSKPKKSKYFCTFQNSWFDIDLYKNWIYKVDSYTVKCLSCNIQFTCKHDGEKALKTHAKSKKHQIWLRSQASSQLLTAFVSKKHSDESNLVTVIEIAQVYHGINHHHSYRSIDCGIKLNNIIYKDSNLAKMVHCGRTKSEAIVQNVLGPKSIEDCLLDLGAKTANTIPFSISSDASNKGNQKMFPIAVRYFHINRGIENKLIDFYENSDESSEAITNDIKSTLEKCGLNIANVSAYSADKASVNYGKHKSVFQKLTAENPNILKANCNCHVIHNAGRNACKVLSYDVENLVLKIYAEFSNSSKKNSKLKECYEYMELEYQKILRHVVTRWLSLFSALERLILSWPAVKSYYLELGEDNCKRVVWEFIASQEHELEEDLRGQLSFPECLIFFLHHYMNLLNTAILKMESNSLTSSEVHAIMEELRSKLESRIKDKFFGSKVMSALKHKSETERQKFEREATQVYQRTVEYLNGYYDFENSPFKHFSIMNIKIKQSISFEKILELVDSLRENINQDDLYDELTLLNGTLEKFDENCFENDSLDQAWVKIFKHGKFPQLFKIVAKIMSIPVSNAYVERVFALMSNLWTDERNRMSVNLVKGELCTKLNFKMTCQEFAEYLSKVEQKELIRCCQNSEKYKF